MGVEVRSTGEEIGDLLTELLRTSRKGATMLGRRSVEMRSKHFAVEY